MVIVNMKNIAVIVTLMIQEEILNGMGENQRDQDQRPGDILRQEVLMMIEEYRQEEAEEEIAMIQEKWI